MARICRTSMIAALATAGLLGAAPPPRLAATTLTVGVACYPLGGGQLQCVADTEGGIAPYSYAWSPPPPHGGGRSAIIPCNPYHYRTVSVTVTDASSDTATDSASFYCGDAV